MFEPSRLLVCSLLLVAACREVPPAAALPCTLVMLRTGPARDVPKDKQQELFAGHFANMMRLAKARDLLLAGPYGEVRHAADLRGIFVLDTPDRAHAQQLAGTDPTSQAGIFALEYHDFATTAPLRALLEAEMARVAADERQGIQRPPGSGCRSYVLLTAENGEQALAALAGHTAVLIAGRLDGTKALFVLDAESCDQVPSLLGDAATHLGPHVVDAWFATDGIARLCKRG